VNLGCGIVWFVIMAAFYAWVVVRVTKDIIEERQKRKRDKMAGKGP